jgi:hypothetical protein
MGEAGRGSGFAPKPLELIGLIGDLSMKELDRHRAIEDLIEGEVHGRHPAGTQLRLEPVSAREHRGAQAFQA